MHPKLLRSSYNASGAIENFLERDAFFDASGAIENFLERDAFFESFGAIENFLERDAFFDISACFVDAVFDAFSFFDAPRSLPFFNLSESFRV